MYKGAVDGRSQGAFHLQPRRPVPTWAPSVNCSTRGLGPGLFGLGTRVAGAMRRIANPSVPLRADMVRL